MLTKKWKNKVVILLIKDFKWSREGAERWVNGHIDYMTSMCESATPEWETATFINEMVESPW